MDNIRDKRFKENLEDKDNAIVFLNVSLPKKVLSLLDLDTLTNIKETFTTPELKEYIC